MAINKVVYGNTTLIDLTGDTVASEKMLQGTTAHASNGDAVTGTIITKTSSALSASGSIVTVPSGYYATQATKAVASVVQATPTITVSAAGLITATTTQSAGYVAAGSKSATKQLTAKAAATYTPNTKNQTIASGQYLKGVQTIKGDANLVAANIKNNVSIFGIKGTYETPAYAVISVIYPSGSTCTCTNDTKTLTLKNTSGQGFFLIPYAATWKVTCTDGKRTKSVNVNITSNGQTESIKIGYELYLFNNGVVDGIAWGANSNDTWGSSSVSDTITLKATSAWSGDLFYSSSAKRGTSAAYNLSEYTTLKVNMKSISGDKRYVRLLIGSSQLSNNILTKDLTTANNTTTSIDISSINGSYYITLYIGSHASGSTTLITVYDKIWLE